MNKLTLKSIGLTGGIGSGKSVTAKIFSVLGVPVYYSDKESKRLLIESESLKKALIKAFGEAIYFPNGSLNKAHFAHLIFNNPAAMAKANSIIWPAVKADFNMWLENQRTPYVIQESALLFESETAERHRYVIVTDAPEELRIQRVIQRDKLSKQAVVARMQNQMPQEEKNKKADFIVINDEKQMLMPQVLDLHKKFLNS